MTDFGRFVKASRWHSGMRVFDLADRVGLSKTELTQIESGHIVPTEPAVLRKLADALGVSRGTVFERAGHRPHCRLLLKGEECTCIAVEEAPSLEERVEALERKVEQMSRGMGRLSSRTLGLQPIGKGTRR